MKVDNNYDSHLNYPAINVEWVLNNSGHTLCSYMDNVLCICTYKVVGPNALSIISDDLLRYAGIMDYYVRNVYGYGYKSSRYVHGILAGRHMMDPWNREFLVFPGDVSSKHSYDRYYGHSYEKYYSEAVANTVYWDELKFKGDVNDMRHNVMLLATTVHGSIVYCLDILAGEYNKV
jgi:hypothetical protein